MNGKYKGFPNHTERLREIQSEKFSLTNVIWNEERLNTVSRVGKVFFAVKVANREYLLTSDCSASGPVMPLTYWENFYFTEVKTEKEVLYLAEEFRERCALRGIKLTSRQALCFVMYRVIDQTYNGFVNENLAFLLLQNSMPNIELSISSDLMDRSYAVDFIGRQGGKIVKAYQQKPSPFFRALEHFQETGKPDWVRQSAGSHMKSNSDFFKVYHVNVEYISLEENEDHTISIVNHGFGNELFSPLIKDKKIPFPK